VSIGGGFSNHLHALGYLCKTLQIPFTALVRGNYQYNMTPTLKDLKQWSTDIVFINRVTYEQRDTPEFLNDIARQYPGSLFVPEGGSTQSALTGVMDICEEINGQLPMAPSHILAPVASGATLAGLIRASQPETKVMGIAVLKGEEYLEQQVSRFLELERTNWVIRHEFVHGGYAKRSSQLTTFIEQFIEIVSARDIHQEEFPNEVYKWKETVFKNLIPINFRNSKNVQNIVSIGDADYEYHALINLDNFNYLYPKRRLLKAIRFNKSPTYGTLLDQLNILTRVLKKIILNPGHLDLKFEDI
jgi:hypothetical protein